MISDLSDDDFQPLVDAYRIYALHQNEEVRKVREWCASFIHWHKIFREKTCYVLVWAKSYQPNLELLLEFSLLKRMDEIVTRKCSWVSCPSSPFCLRWNDLVFSNISFALPTFQLYWNAWELEDIPKDCISCTCKLYRILPLLSAQPLPLLSMRLEHSFIHL